MGYQFIHMECYSRKPDVRGRSTDFVFAEAARNPECCIHVASPAPPVVVFGVGIKVLQEIHDTTAAAATIAVKGGHVRKLATDKKTLHAIVASYPTAMDDIRRDQAKREEAEEWERRTVAWLRSQYGSDLKTVIRHEDEKYYHIHAYVVPISESGMSALKYHPGTMAKRAVMDSCEEGEDRKVLSKRADAAYKCAMRQWQDSYYDAVAIPCGLTRLGPQRRRLSRAEWQREQVQAQALKKTCEKAKAVKAKGEAFIAKMNADAAQIAAAAAREREAARKVATAVLAAQDRVRATQEQARASVADAIRYAGWAGRLRAVWDRLRKSSLVEKVRGEFSGEIDRWRGIAREAERGQFEAERRCHEAEKKAREAQDAAFRTGIERDRLQSMLTPVAHHSAADLPSAPKLQLKPKWKNERGDT